jgi:N utilization substance protein A
VRLFEVEIPEIAEGIVQVRGAAREPGERAKLAVASTKRDVDPIGACVGLRGTRIQAIVKELRGEKIDILEWSDDLATLVARALAPAKVASVTIQGEGDERTALVVVPDNQLSLAIGKKGQNARLAAKLTGMRIDIKSESEIESERAAPSASAGLAGLADLKPETIEALAEAGFATPEAIVQAGRERLAQVPGIGDRADEVLRAAEERVTAAAATAAEPEGAQGGAGGA